MPFVSIIVPTMRVGGLDVLFDSLAKQTFTDFELVLVDGLYEQRRDLVLEEARDRFLCVRHVGLRPNPFPVASFCRYSNVGIAVSTGEVLLFMVDYSQLPPDLVGRHARFHTMDPTGRCGMMGPHRYLKLDVNPEFPRYGHEPSETDRYEADVKSGALNRFMWSIGNATDRAADPHHADGGAIVPFDADPKLRMPAGPIGPEYFHAKNESVRRQRVLEVDGYDQELDGAHLYQDSDFSDRLSTKAGVRWMLDPSAVVEIVNPRHVFPYARRLRPHEENKAIWERKKAAGYPPEAPRLVPLKVKERETELVPLPPPPPMQVELPGRIDKLTLVGSIAEEPKKRLRLGMIYGEFSSAIHGPFDMEGLYTRVGLTGSESSFFNLARTMAERGHEVAVFCDCPAPYEHSSGFMALPIHMLEDFQRKTEGVDAVLAWNEPDYLQFAPAGAKRICDQQLNDFGYAGSPWYASANKWLGTRVRPDWRNLVDVWVGPSENHRQNVMVPELAGKTVSYELAVIPNSVDLDLFEGPQPPRQKRVVWCSSPDRGLHHLLSFWPQVRKRIPTAELHVFYRLAPWLAATRQNPDVVGQRARYVEMALEALRPLGVVVHDSVPNVRMANELKTAACLAYPCDPVRYTEGFGCSVLDAAAAGCLPIISGADALPEVHGSAVIGIPGDPQGRKEAWVESIVGVLEGRYDHTSAARAMKEHAQKHSRQRVADLWEALLSR